MNRARIKNIINLENNITRAIIHHFMRFKVQNTQEQEFYTKQDMDLRNREIDFLLVFEESCKTVVILMLAGKTDGLRSSKWWLVKMIWLNEAGHGDTRILPWKLLWKTSWPKAAYRWRKMVVMSLKWCLDDAATMVWSWPFESFGRFWKMIKMRFFWEWMDFWVFNGCS